MKRISVVVVGLALMGSQSAFANDLPVPLPQVPLLPQVPIPSLPQVPAPSLPPVPAPSLPPVPVPAPSLPPVPTPSLPPVEVPSAGSPTLPGTPGVGTIAPRPGAGSTQPAGSQGAGAAAGGASGSVRPGTAASTTPSAGQKAGGGRSAGPVQARRERRRVVLRERRLRDSVRRFGGCLDGLAPLERKVLVLRAGLGEERTRTRRRVARLLDLNAQRVRRVELSGLRRLRALGRDGSCGAAPPAGGGASVPAAVPVLWTNPTASLGFPLGRLGVKGEQDSSDPELALTTPPKAAVPAAGAVVQKARDGAGIDLTIFLLVLFNLALIAYAVFSIRKLRSD